MKSGIVLIVAVVFPLISYGQLSNGSRNSNGSTSYTFSSGAGSTSFTVPPMKKSSSNTSGRSVNTLHLQNKNIVRRPAPRYSSSGYSYSHSEPQVYNQPAKPKEDRTLEISFSVLGMILEASGAASARNQIRIDQAMAAAHKSEEQQAREFASGNAEAYSQLKGVSGAAGTPLGIRTDAKPRLFDPPALGEANNTIDREYIVYKGNTVNFKELTENLRATYEMEVREAGKTVASEGVDATLGFMESDTYTNFLNKIAEENPQNEFVQMVASNSEFGKLTLEMAQYRLAEGDEKKTLAIARVIDWTDNHFPDITSAVKANPYFTSFSRSLEACKSYGVIRAGAKAYTDDLLESISGGLHAVIDGNTAVGAKLAPAVQGKTRTFATEIIYDELGSHL